MNRSVIYRITHLLLIFCVFISTSGCTKGMTQEEREVREVEAYKIYAMLLGSDCSNQELKYYSMIQEHTVSWNENTDLTGEDTKKEWENIPEPVRNDFLTENRKTEQLSKHFPTNCPYSFISESDAGKILQNDETWVKANQGKGKGISLVTFSKVGFNSSLSQALVYESGMCGPTCGAGNLYYLTNQPGTGWKVEKTIILWIS